MTFRVRGYYTDRRPRNNDNTNNTNTNNNNITITIDNRYIVTAIYRLPTHLYIPDLDGREKTKKYKIGYMTLGRVLRNRWLVTTVTRRVAFTSGRALWYEWNIIYIYTYTVTVVQPFENGDRRWKPKQCEPLTIPVPRDRPMSKPRSGDEIGRTARFVCPKSSAFIFRRNSRPRKSRAPAKFKAVNGGNVARKSSVAGRVCHSAFRNRRPTRFGFSEFKVI